MSSIQFSNISEADLFKTPIPAETISYKPVAHKDVIEGIQESLDKYNLHIVNKSYKAARDNNKLIGLFDISSGDSSLGFRFGFKNSYDKSMSLGFAAGNVVWI